MSVRTTGAPGASVIASRRWLAFDHVYAACGADSQGMNLADKYRNFAALDAGERCGIDYRVRLADLGTAIIVIAPHGGEIEPGTSELTLEIARGDYAFYAFEGLRRGRLHGDLHLTSPRFDEPRGLALIGAADTALAVHGRADNGDAWTIWAGGRAEAFRDAVATSLIASGFKVTNVDGGLAGREAANICNRGASGTGVQLEIPRTLRRHLRRDPTALRQFGDAVRLAMLAR